MCRLGADVFISSEYTLPSTALLPPLHFYGAGTNDRHADHDGGHDGDHDGDHDGGPLQPGLASIRRVLLLHDLTPEKFRWKQASEISQLKSELSATYLH